MLPFQLEVELASSREKLNLVDAVKTGENNALRMALMRGVCALNMETMSLFNNDMPSESPVRMGSGSEAALLSGDRQLGEKASTGVWQQLFHSSAPSAGMNKTSSNVHLTPPEHSGHYHVGETAGTGENFQCVCC